MLHILVKSTLLRVLKTSTCTLINSNISRIIIKRNYASNKITKNIYLIDEDGEDRPLEISDSNKYTNRTHNCGELRLNHVGQRVTLCGWLDYQRMNKFIVLRDGYGHTQLIIGEKEKQFQTLINSLPYETIIQIKGTVLSRPQAMKNNKEKTGEIEVLIHTLDVLNRANDRLPFNLREFQKAKEDLRMQYRYLDFRFPEMQRNMRVRSKVLMNMRNFLVNQRQFVDIETPTLFKSTPGGAQEFIVPTRFPGQFYSLVQSPQQFKQMLMAGAIDRYFQIARCYRDEGSRSDRQPEFTQLDIEMSFTNMEGVINLIEELLENSWPDSVSPLPKSFIRMKYEDALERYGTDKPDIRYEFLLKNCTNILKTNSELSNINFGAYCIIFKGPYNILSTSVKKKFAVLANNFKTVKLIANKVTNCGEWINKISKLFGKDVTHKLQSYLTLEDDFTIFLSYGNKLEVLSLLGIIRKEYVDVLEEEGLKIKKEGMHPLWITDFPLFEADSKKPGKLVSAHHPFTAPYANDVHLLATSPLQVRAQAYDLVLNGNEVAGGSIRIHDPILQDLIFQMLNIDSNSMKYIMAMLGSGCPPHGGIAIGLDRLLATMLQTNSIRDVIAFPKSFEGRDLLSGAPSLITEHDKNLYNLEIINNKGKLINK